MILIIIVIIVVVIIIIIIHNSSFFIILFIIIHHSSLLLPPAVSADLVTWAHLPVAVWNDQPYDNVAIYTGSATIVNGVPTMVYPGLCVKEDWPSCNTGTLLAIALPADYKNDPLLTNWTKPAYNPIVNNTERDPSTAWQTASGEWRLTTYEGKVYSSKDFVNWGVASGGQAIFPVAECPDFFPVPAKCKGNGCDLPAPSGAVTPTHVHKQSSDGADWYTLGVYVEGADGTAGQWTPISSAPQLQPLDASTPLGLGFKFYASKSFFDPVGEDGAGRRIYWGWAVVAPDSVQTLPRVTTYHAALQQLIFTPLPELAALRDIDPLYSQAKVAVPAGGSVWLGDWPLGAGNQSEASATFVLPSKAEDSVSDAAAAAAAANSPITFGIRFMVGNAASRFDMNGGAAGKIHMRADRKKYMQQYQYQQQQQLQMDDMNAVGDGFNASTTVQITFDPVSFTANVSAGAVQNLSYYMPGYDLPGGDYNVTDVDYKDPHVCQAACTADGDKCQAYTYVIRGPKYASCCLKSTTPMINPNPTCTSGSKSGGQPPKSIPLPLLPGDLAIDVRVFVDNTFAEVYIMQGRLAITMDIKYVPEAGMELFVSQGGNDITALDVNVWHLNSIWRSTEEVLSARKRV